MEPARRQRLTEALAGASRGDESVVAVLLRAVYGELRALAGTYLRDQGPGHTLQPTALVHEAYLKLLGAQGVAWQSRAHFFAVAAKAMRQVLTDHARRKRAVKRGGVAQRRVTLSGLATPLSSSNEVDLLALEAALAKLSELSPRQSEIVEMRFFAGLDESEVAHVLGVSSRTVQREWRMAKAFLRCELRGEPVS